MSRIFLSGGAARTAFAALLLLTSCSPEKGDTGGTPSGDASPSSGGSGGSIGGGSGAGPGGASGNGGGFLTGGTGGQSAIADGGCAESTLSAEQTKANVLFVIDKSGSMNCCPPPVTDSATCESFPVQGNCVQSKWHITRDALGGVLNDMEQAGNVSAGIMMFPVIGGTDCARSTAADVPIQLLDATHNATLQSFLAGVVPEGSTPLVGSTIGAYQYLTSAAVRSLLVGANTFVVLVTDGAESCMADVESLISQAPTALSVNIRTFVIGAPGSETASGTLSRLAAAGGTSRTPTCDSSGADPAPGTECHFDMTTATDFAAELRAAFATISQRSELTCEFLVPESQTNQQVDLDKVNVNFTPGDGSGLVKILQDQQSNKPCAEAEGWQYAENSTKIVLCGDICQRVSSDLRGQVNILLGCDTEIF